jgi:hypothetical protein
VGSESTGRRHRRRIAHHRAAERPPSWSSYRAYPGRVARALYVLLGLLVGPLAFLAWTEEAGSDKVGWWIALAAGIVVVALGVRFATMGIFLSPAGVTVRNFLRTYQVPWGKVVDFDLGRNGLSLHTKDDVIPCWSYFSPRSIPQFSLDLFYRPAHTRLQAALREHAGRDAGATARLAPGNGRTTA